MDNLKKPSAGKSASAKQSKELVNQSKITTFFQHKSSTPPARPAVATTTTTTPQSTSAHPQQKQGVKRKMPGSRDPEMDPNAAKKTRLEVSTSPRQLPPVKKDLGIGQTGPAATRTFPPIQTSSSSSTTPMSQQNLMAKLQQGPKKPELHPLKRETGAESHQDFRKILGNTKEFETRYQGYDKRDPNIVKLIGVIEENHKNFQKDSSSSNPDVKFQAGYVNEARMFDRTLRKYDAFSKEEKSKRTYYPQTTISGAPVQKRRPDLLKIKQDGDKSHATFTEFKSKQFDEEQRIGTLAILSEPESMSVTHGSRNSRIDLTHTPIAKYKTVFAGNFERDPFPPIDPGRSQLTTNAQGEVKLKGTNISVYSKLAASQKK